MAEQEDLLRKISLAGLLHDIGKIIYRAGEGTENHSSLGRKLLDTYCANLPGFQGVLQSLSYHHGKQLQHAMLHSDSIAYLIYEADNIAAGMDRRKDEGEDLPYGFDRTAPLESIFNYLSGTCADEDKAYHYLRGLTENSDKINYGIVDHEIRASKDKYQGILKTIKDNLSSMDFKTATAAELLKVLEATCSYIPSSTANDEVADISLYDHVKLTAAIANVLYIYLHDTKQNDYRSVCFTPKGTEQLRHTDVFLLVSGDLSGIQNFIYTASGAGALKSLRGRSFYLDMVMEYLIDEILSVVGLNRCNLIYSGGGHFYMLLPNTTDIKKQLISCKEKINDWFLKHTGAMLYLELGDIPCTAMNFMTTDKKERLEGHPYNRTGDLFRAVGDVLGRQKLQRYTADQLAAMFNPKNTVNEMKNGSRECAICHTSSVILQEQSMGEKLVEVCPLCWKLYKFGRLILEENVIFIVQSDIAGLPLPSLDEKPRSLHAISEIDLKKNYNEKILRLYVKNEMKTSSILGTHLWVGDYSWNKGVQNIDFNSLAQASHGIKRLGILRGDVDWLGRTFATAFRSGTGSQYVTLSRMASLSRQLSLFFKKYMNHICAGHVEGEGENQRVLFSIWGLEEKRDRKIVIVYSGGDDIFVVGAWDDLLGFAVDLYGALQRFTQGKITLSAGLSLLPADYPIRRMAEAAGELEDYAKNNPSNDKNSIALFGLTEEYHRYSWPDFIDSVVQEKLKFLLEHCSFKEDNSDARLGKGHLVIGKGQLYHLIEFLRTELAAEKPLHQERRQRLNIARFLYWLARLEPDKYADEVVRADYSTVKIQLYAWVTAAGSDEQKQLLTALTLVIYGIRGQDDK